MFKDGVYQNVLGEGICYLSGLLDYLVSLDFVVWPYIERL